MRSIAAAAPQLCQEGLGEGIDKVMIEGWEQGCGMGNRDLGEIMSSCDTHAAVQCYAGMS